LRHKEKEDDISLAASIYESSRKGAEAEARKEQEALKRRIEN
jgi:hypothetical protein